MRFIGGLLMILAIAFIGWVGFTLAFGKAPTNTSINPNVPLVWATATPYYGVQPSGSGSPPSGGNVDGQLSTASNHIVPPSPAPGAVTVIHGDIDGTGTCHVHVFTPGSYMYDPPLRGVYRIRIVSGTSEQINQRVSEIQQAAAGDAGAACPTL